MRTEEIRVESSSSYTSNMVYPGGFDPPNRRVASELDLSISETDILGSAASPSRPSPSAPPIMGTHGSIPGSVQGSPPLSHRGKLPPMKNVVHPMPQQPLSRRSSVGRGDQPPEGAARGGWRVPEPEGDPYTTERSDSRIDDLLNTLECPVCLDPAEDPPIYQCPEGHLLCEDCNSRLVDCPQCGHSLMNSRNRTAEELAVKLKTLRGSQRQGFLPSQKIAVDVGEPLKRRKGLFAHVVYQLTTKIDQEVSVLPHSSNPNLYNVHRQYSEIVKLYEKLVKEYEDSGVIVPPPPSKSSLATVAVKMSTNVELNESIASAFIEKRTVALDRYLKRLCRHPVIRKDPNFRTFIQEIDIPKDLLKSKSFSEKFDEWKKSFSFFRTKITVSEQDPWFQTKKVQLKELSKQLRGMKDNLKDMSKQKSKLSEATNEFQAGLMSMVVSKSNRETVASSSGNSNNLSQVITQVVDCHKTMGLIHQEQSKADQLIVQLAEDYVHMVEAAQKALATRRNVQDDVKKVSKGKNDDATEDVKKVQAEFDKLSQTVRREFEHFDFMMKEEFEEAFNAYNAKYWKSLRLTKAKSSPQQ